MKTAIIYTTHHGTTYKVAEKLSSLASSEVTLFNLKKNSKVPLAEFDQIIIGGSIHAGKVQKVVQKFCLEHQQELLSKPLGLFLCCMEESEKAQTQFEEAFPADLRRHARSCKLTGGEILFEKMNFIEKFIMKKMAKTTESVYHLKEERIKELAQEMAI